MNDTGFQQSGLPEFQQRLGFLKVGVLVVIGLLALRLWQLQVRDGPYYRELSQDNRTRSILLHPARGLIYDRNGKLLANNIPSFNLYVELKDVKDREALIVKLVKYLDFDKAELGKKVRTHSSRTRVKLKGGLTLREAALVESHRLNLPGVVVHPEFQRNNPRGPYAAHVIGYVGEVSEQQLSQEDFQGLNPNGFDHNGNFTFGIKEHIIFPEINFDKVDRIRGMDITLCTTGNNKKASYALLKAMNFPFYKTKGKKGLN